MTPVETLSSTHPTVNNDPDVPNIAEQHSEMDLEEDEQEHAQELIAQEPEENNEDLNSVRKVERQEKGTGLSSQLIPNS